MERDFKVELAKQLNFLRVSCEGFDEGNHDEAIRIAMVLRVLLSDAPVSLVTHMVQAEVRLLSTSMDIAAKLRDPWLRGARLQMFNGMGQFSLGSNSGYYPKLSTNPMFERFLPASEWRSEIVLVLGPEDQDHVTRERIFRTAADKDGGAHVDRKLPGFYDDLVRSNRLGSWVGPDGQLTDIGGHHYVALRQMGHEILNSPDLIALAAANEKIPVGGRLPQR